MSFRHESTLAGYARAAVDLKTRMHEVGQSRLGQQYLSEFVQLRLSTDGTVSDSVVDAVGAMTSAAWSVGEPYVLAPTMSAIIAAAAEALDLTGEVLPADLAPSDYGVLFLPEPLYRRRPDGQVTSVGAITWSRFTAGDRAAWAVCGWADRDDPLDPNAARLRAHTAQTPEILAGLGPYVLSDFDHVPIGEPLQEHDVAVVDDADRDWEPAPDGRYVLDDTYARTSVVTPIAYAFWRIQAQPLATVVPAPLDRAARRRAVRASIVHNTRVVMLRRVSPLTERPDGEAKWHYRVRFLVRGHWRHLTGKDGHRYRIWIHAHIKGPDGAPMLTGEKVAILAR